jgi:hypothetical protein
MLMGSTGRDEVAKSVDNFLDYYVTHASAENRLVREVSCFDDMDDSLASTPWK